MKLAKNSLVMAGILLSSTLAFAGGTEIGSGTLEIKCQVQMAEDVKKEMGITRFDAEVIQLDGKLAGKVNNAIYNRDIKPVDFKVTTIDGDPYQDTMNDAERRLNHIQTMVSEGLALPLSMDLNKVKLARLFDLDGESSTNQFGGVVLMELFDQDGKLLGRLLSSMLPGECR